jgi:hypothetical protein
MYMDESALHCSDPQASIAVQEQLIRIDISAPEHFIGIAYASDRIRFEFVTRELPDLSPVHREEQPSVIGLSQGSELDWWRGESPRGAGLPTPKPRVCTGPKSAGAVLI